jgi:hypothetical protein
MASNNEESRYSVGYRKPPQNRQFKPGQSGNPKGRPKGAKNFATVFAEELLASIEVTENGKRKRISKQRALIKHTINKAVTGDTKSTVVVLNQARLNEGQNQSFVPEDALVGPADQLVMDNIVRRIRQSIAAPPDSGLSENSGAEEKSDMPPQSDEGAN